MVRYKSAKVALMNALKKILMDFKMVHFRCKNYCFLFSESTLRIFMKFCRAVEQQWISLRKLLLASKWSIYLTVDSKACTLCSWKKFFFWNFPQWRGTVSKQKIEINTLGSKRAAVPRFKSKISLLFFLETFLKVH